MVRTRELTDAENQEGAIDAWLVREQERYGQNGLKDGRRGWPSQERQHQEESQAPHGGGWTKVRESRTGASY